MGSVGGAGRFARTLAAFVVALAALGVAANAALAAGPAVVSGGFAAQVGDDPFDLQLTQGPGQEPVLAQDPGLGSGPTGTLGFEAAGSWRHATEVLTSSSGRGSYEATLATNDPLGRRIQLSLQPDGRGVIALRATVTGAAVDAIGIGFRAHESERYLGFGERSNAVDQAGRTIENYVSDGPYQSTEYPLLNLFVPPWGLRERDDSTYFPIPWLLSSAGYGVLVDSPETSSFRLGSDEAGAWSVELRPAPPGEAVAPPPVRTLALRFFAGPTPALALKRFSGAVGRQPLPQAPWVYGSWFQDDKPEGEGVAALRDADAPVSALQTYLHYLPCGDQRGVESEQPARTDAAHEQGLAITTYFNPMVCSNYDAAYGPAAAAGALTRKPNGAPYTYRYGANPTDANIVGQYDFSKQRGRELYGERLQEAIGDGYDGWMEDFGEYTPLDSLSGAGVPGTRAHNPYPTRYHCAAYAATRHAPRPIVRFQRSGWTGSARCAQVVWGGDPTTDWGFDGLRSAVRQALTMGLSGVSVWGSDIGGFFSIGRDLPPELLERWVQFGAVSAVMRTQRNGVAVPSIERPQVEDPEQIANWRRWAKLHTQLYPYSVAAQRTYARTGMPLMRHMALLWPDRPRARAPATTSSCSAPTSSPLPSSIRACASGRWRCRRVAGSTSGARPATAERDGGLSLGKAKVVRGKRVTVPAPADELPLLARAGTILPLLPADDRHARADPEGRAQRPRRPRRSPWPPRAARLPARHEPRPLPERRPPALLGVRQRLGAAPLVPARPHLLPAGFAQHAPRCASARASSVWTAAACRGSAGATTPAAGC